MTTTRREFLGLLAGGFTLAVVPLRSLGQLGHECPPLIGDGVYDNTPAIRHRLTEHGHLYLPPGHFRITGGIRVEPGQHALIRGGTWITGAGEDATVITGQTW